MTMQTEVSIAHALLPKTQGVDGYIPTTYITGASLATLIYFLLPDRGISQELLYDLVGISTVAAMILGILWNAPPHPRPWWLLAVGTGFLVLGDITYSLYVAAGGDPPFPSIADGFYLIGTLLLVVAMLLLLKRRTRQNVRTSLFEALIVVAGTGLGYWVLFINHSAGAGISGVFALSVAFAYPVFDLILIAVTLRFVLAGRFRTHTDMLLLSGALLLLVADALYGSSLRTGNYDTGDLTDAAWLLSYIAFGGAALHPSMASEKQSSGADMPRRLTSQRLIVLALVAFAGPIGIALQHLTLEPSDLLVIGSAAVICVAALSRVGRIALRLDASVGELTVAKYQLTISEARYRALLEHGSEVVFVVNESERVTYVSPPVTTLLGFPPAELVGLDIATNVHPDDSTSMKEELRQLAGLPGRSAVLTVRAQHADGSWRWLEAIGTNRFDDPAVGGIIVNVRDVTQRHQAEIDLEFRAYHDPLTELPNRRYLFDRLDHLLKDDRDTIDELAVIYIDLDHFKRINDALGDGIGDECLREIGRRLSACAGDSNIVCRLGGDEFVVIHLNATDATTRSLAGCITSSFATKMDIPKFEVLINGTIGIAMTSPGMSNTQELMRNAESALAYGKRHDRGMTTVFTPDMDEPTGHWLLLEADLRQALAWGEFLFHYQPIVDLATDRVSAVEALIRWNHPIRGIVKPGEFLPLAEDSQLIVPMTAMLLNAACRQLTTWRSILADRAPSIMNVNISARNLRDPNFFDSVRDAVVEAGIPPRKLRLEITERVLIDELRDAAPVLRALHAFGVSLAIDDFGTGSTSLAMLGELEFNVLKLDRALVQKIASKKERTIIEGIVTMAHGLGMQVVAEGVETVEQLEAVRAAGCDDVQGYLLCMPIPSEQLVPLLAINGLLVPAPGLPTNFGPLQPVTLSA